MKFELHECTNPADILNRLAALMTFHEFLIGRVREVELSESPEDKYQRSVVSSLRYTMAQQILCVDKLKIQTEKHVFSDIECNVTKH